MTKLKFVEKLELTEIRDKDFYTLSIDHQPTQTVILMKLLIPELTTRYFPQTHKLLGLYLPTIFKSACYNDEHLSFPQEVACTELGHLFEHILLEYLCIIKLESGLEYASFEGVTNWDWTKDPMGTFYITVNTKYQELEVLSSAVDKTVTLMNIILSKNKDYSSLLSIPGIITRH